MSVPILIRTPHEDDFPFIIDSWLHSYQQSQFAQSIRRDIYRKWHRNIILRVLKNAQTRIATDDKSSDLIYGYAVFEQYEEFKIFHYIYIKRPFNHFGISTDLINASPFPIEKGVYASHLTPMGSWIIEKYQLLYNPYLV
jgi:hypothetical protein